MFFFKLQNPFSAGAPLQIPLGEITTLPKLRSRLGETPPLYTLPLDAFGVSISSRRRRRLRCLVSWPHQYKVLDTHIMLLGRPVIRRYATGLEGSGSPKASFTLHGDNNECRRSRRQTVASVDDPCITIQIYCESY